MRIQLVAATAALALFAGCSGSVPPPATPLATNEPTAVPTPTLDPTAAWTPAPDLDQARLLLRLGEFEQAAATFRAFAETASDPEVKAQALLGAAVALGEGGNSSASLEGLDEAMEAAPEGSRVARQAAYLLGRRLNEAEAFGEAATVLRPFVDDPVPDRLQPYLAGEYATGAWRSGDEAGAAEAWEQVLADPASPVRLQSAVYADRAAAAASRGDLAGQREWLARYVESSSDPSGRLQLAILQANAGETTAATAQFRAIVTNNPGSSASVLAIEEMDARGISYNLGEAGLACYRARLYAQARDLLLQAVAENVSDVALTFRNYYLAAAYEGLGSYSTAIRYYDTAAAFGAATPFNHRARWWGARLTEDLEDLAGASDRYLALVTGGPTGEFTQEAAFRAGYALLRAGDPTAAVATWAQVGAVEDPRLFYWRGRSHSDLGDDAAAAASYAAAIEADSSDFHAIEAARELGRPVPGYPDYTALEPPRPIDWDGLAKWVAAVEPGVLRDVDSGAVADLLEVGLRQDARQALLDLAGDSDPWAMLAAAREAHELGMADVGVTLASRLRTAAGSGAPDDLERLLYPLDYVALLDSEAEKYGFDPLFFAGLIRQESLWNPSAGSTAGALGLTQVIPPTGEAIAAELGVVDFTPTDLFRPAVAIRFGAYYIGGQLDHYEDPYAAMAAYNAGPGNAARWAAASEGGTPADFLAAVDFSETILYVELVWENYARYLRLYRPGS